MNNRLSLHILSAATVLLFAATACTQDDLGGGTLPEGEYPLVINATGLQAVATPASTRATVDGDWQGVQTVAVEMGGTVKEYDVTASDADGYKTATLSSDTDPFWWTSREDITVSAWWPYGTTMPDVVVKADQSTKEGFEGSDFIFAEAQTVQFDNPTLEFSHRTARITVLLKPGAGITSVSGADVYVTGLGTDNSNPATIRTYEAGGDTYEALTAPQTVKANTPFIQVDLGGGTYYFRPHSDVVLAAGSRYTYTVNVNATGLTLEGCTIGGWTDGGSENGTAEDLGYFIQDDGSYTVYTANGLKEWAEAVQTDPTLNITLTADIDLTGETWTPIGSGFSSNTGYQGTFDGQGHSITGLSITTNSTDGGNAVLFDGIGSNGTVKNLQVEVNYNVQQGVASGIVNVNYGTITACSVTGDIAARTSDIGGIASINNGSIIGCWFDGNLTTNYVEGGIAAYNYGTITACFYGGNAGYGANNQGGTVDATKVNDGDSWQTAVDGMNEALTGNGYQWKLGENNLPVLQKNQ
ncbi:fimbrillin family protein [Bacteroides ovatus]|jgi:hypothetical protein|uniref:fimbrillin family protein n=1 Tax=Bacteroides ovatus TaxID=28116 RepID=UPI0022E70727|nr:fimbrillin family protein [Bacteroides ovatus]